MDKPQYIKWFIEENEIKIKDNIPIKCYKINYEENEDILNDWALHIRRNYIEDEDLRESASINEMSIEKYLYKYIIPQKHEYLGPSARSADITEILVADLLEFIFNYSVPRYKLINRSGKNNSQQGTDVIAYKYKNADKSPNNKDELIAAEVKARLSIEEYTPLENAIKDSKKDQIRLARTIDYCRKRLKELGKTQESKEITRFLQKSDNNYKLIFAAVGISSHENVDKVIELSVSGEELEIKKDDKIFYIHGKDLMRLAHNIYERCNK